MISRTSAVEGRHRTLPLAQVRRVAGPGQLERHTNRPRWRPSPLFSKAIRARCCSQRRPRGPALAGNVLGSRARMARAFGVPPEKLARRDHAPFAQASRRFVELTSAQAPVHEVILTGDDADVTKLPVHLQHGRDGGPYISAAIDICDRSGDRLDQRRPAPLDAARQARDRHRSRRGERSEQHLPSRRRARRTRCR